jgi:hypothetical protein
MYEPSVFVEPLGYQPVEFLDIPQMGEHPDERMTPRGDCATSVATTARGQRHA